MRSPLDTLHLRSTLEAGSPSEAQALYRRYVREQIASSDAEAQPDSRYWFDYDYFMIEREARAVRREHIYASLVSLARLPARILAWMPRRNAQKRLSF
jgi:hypothetical protein